jgi:hypothetical protein
MLRAARATPSISGASPPSETTGETARTSSSAQLKNGNPRPVARGHAASSPASIVSAAPSSSSVCWGQGSAPA